MAIIYKTLFEIRLYHEYFLTKNDGSTIFENNTQELRNEYLENEFKGDRESINGIVQFQFPKHLEHHYDSVGLKVIPTYSGCRVAGRVLAKTLPDASVVYELLSPLGKENKIYIHIDSKASELDRLSNARIKRSCPALYLFSNDRLTDDRTFPFLTNPIPLRDPIQVYEQGELSASGGSIEEYFSDGGVDLFRSVAGFGFANERDRLLLPTAFQYNFSNAENLTDVSFVLTDNGGTVIASETKGKPSGLEDKVSLNFTGKVKSIGVNSSRLTENVYDLKVEGNNGLSVSHQIVFSNEMTNEKPWGVIAIDATIINDPFSIFASDNYLIRRLDKNGIVVPAPVFEIPVKSRLAYWKFRHNKGKPLIVAPVLNDYLNKEADVLVTKRPRSLARSWFHLRKEGSPGTAYVPNPTSFDLRLEPDRRLIFEVMVPQSDLFPEAP